MRPFRAVGIRLRYPGRFGARDDSRPVALSYFRAASRRRRANGAHPYSRGQRPGLSGEQPPGCATPLAATILIKTLQWRVVPVNSARWRPAITVCGKVRGAHRGKPDAARHPRVRFIVKPYHYELARQPSQLDGGVFGSSPWLPALRRRDRPQGNGHALGQRG